MARMLNPGDSTIASATIAAESPNSLARNSRWERSQQKFLVGSIVLVLLLLPLIPAFERGGSPMDEGSLLLYPELIQGGKIPYRDFGHPGDVCLELAQNLIDFCYVGCVGLL